MVWLKRIGITLGVIVVAGGIAWFALDKYLETWSFAPGDPVQIQLAAEHARCAAFYRAMRSSLSKERPNYVEQQEKYTREFELHVKMGANFSPDKALFRSQVEKASSQLSDEVNQVAETEKLAGLLEVKTDQCIATLVRAEAFIKRKREK